ncbi:MAG: single-stranded DNA-binding protein [Planctomycetota bacterium]|jgi:single-stranded DNA-binding protein
MSFYINKVWISGKVHTQPRIRNLSERTKLTSFMVSAMETWASRNGESKSHRNDILVEVLGKEAQPAFDGLSPGDWVSVDGYLRSEQFKGRTVLSVRVYNISYGAEIDDKARKDSPREVRLSIGD